MLSAVKDTFSRFYSSTSKESGVRKRTLEGSAEEEEIPADGAGEPARKRHRTLTETEDCDQNVDIKRQGSVGIKRFIGGNIGGIILQKVSSWMSSFSSTADLSYQNGQESFVFQESDERKVGQGNGVSTGMKTSAEMENRGNLINMHMKNKESMFFSQNPPSNRNASSAPAGKPISHLLDFPIRARPELHPQSSAYQTIHTVTHTSTPKMGMHGVNGGQEAMSPISPVISPEFRFSPSIGTTAAGKKPLQSIYSKDNKFTKPMKTSSSRKIPLFGKKSGSVQKSNFSTHTGILDKFYPSHNSSSKSRFGSFFSRRSSAVQENFGKDKSLVAKFLESQKPWQSRIQDVSSGELQHDPTVYRFRNAMDMIRIQSDDHKATRDYYQKQSYRVEEKMRYKELIQQYNNSQSQSQTSLNSSLLAPSFTSAGSIPTTPSQSRSVSPHLAIQKDVYSASWTNQKRQELEESIRGKSSFLSTEPRISSTQIASSANRSIGASTTLPLGASASIFAKGTHTKITPKRFSKDLSSHRVDPDVVDLDENENKHGAKDSDSDSIIMTGEIRRPSSHYQNSLELRLKQHAVYDKDFFKNLNEKYSSRDDSGKTKAIEQIKTTQMYSEKTEKLQLSSEKRLSRKMVLLDLTYPSKATDLDLEEQLAELTEEMENFIDSWMRGGPPQQQLTEKFSIQITRKDVQTLHGLNWLNDEVINFYMNLLVERGQNNNNMPNVHAFNTFFYPKLVKTGFATIKRWTKKVDVFSQDLLIIPVHLGMHWCLATVDFRDSTIRYYDSMLGDNDRCLQALLEYLNLEHQDKKKSPYNTDGWSMENVKDIPQQMNGSDCGMFACKFAEYLSRAANITFNQEHMPYFRRRMVYEIVTNRLLSP